MALTPEQVNQFRSQYGLDSSQGSAKPTLPTNSGVGSVQTPEPDLSSHLEERVASFKAAAAGKAAVPPVVQSKSTGQKVGGALKAVGGALISSEKNFGEDLSTVFDKNSQRTVEDISKMDAEGQQKLIDAIHAQSDPAKRDHLIGSLKTLYGVDYKPPTAADLNPAFGKTNEQVLGDAGGVLLDTVAAGDIAPALEDVKALKNGAKVSEIIGDSGKLTKGAPSVIKGVQEATKTKGLVKGAIEGAKAGAKSGAVIGGAYGVDQGLQENKGVGGVAISGIQGAAGGAVIGGAGGAIAGAIQGSANAAADKAAAKKQQTALESIVPTPKEMTPSEYEEAVAKGRVTPKTTFGSAKIIPTKQEQDIATKYADVLQSKDPVKNAGAIIDQIKGHDEAVGEYLKSKPIIFNTGELRNSLMNGVKDVTDIYVPNEDRLSKLKGDVVQSLIDEVDTNNLEGLWQGRKSFDKIIDSKVNAFGGSPTLKKEIAVGVRNAAQDFITSKLGDPTYADHMAEMRGLYNVLDAVNTKAAKERGQSAVSLWIKSNPGKVKAAEALLGGGILYEGGKLIITHHP